MLLWIITFSALCSVGAVAGSALFLLFPENIRKILVPGLISYATGTLPKGVFAPYTSIATNILFFEKGGPTKDVWFFEHPYPEGYKSYSRSKPLTIGEFDLEKAWWGGAARKGRKVTEYAWKVPVLMKVSNLSFKTQR